MATAICETNLAQKTAGIEVEELLDFFEDVAFMVKKGAIDKEMAWHAFYHYIRLYFESAKQYILARAEKERTVWSHLRWLYPLLHQIETQESNGARLTNLGDDELRRQLTEELGTL